MEAQLNLDLTPDFRELLPHRDPMIWIDQILMASTDEGLAETVLKENELYFDQGVFYPSAYIELIAQAYAYTMAINGKRDGKELKGCYLTTIDKMQSTRASTLKPGDTLITSVKTVRNLHPAYVLEGKIYNLNNEKLCEAKIKGFAFFTGDQLPFEQELLA